MLAVVFMILSSFLFLCATLIVARSTQVAVDNTYRIMHALAFLLYSLAVSGIVYVTRLLA